jgi:hypothetical protein
MRRLYVPMDQLLDAMDSFDDPPHFFLDTETGEIDLSLDPADEGADRFALVPRAEADERAVLTAFIAGLEDADRKGELLRLMEARAVVSGRGLDAILVDLPELRRAFRAERRARLLRQALAWLAGLGIEPDYELAPLPELRPLGGEPAVAGAARVGLFELLLLGGGDRQDGTDEVSRSFVAAGPEQARSVFVRVARELCLHHGEPWRRAEVEAAGRLALDRCRLILTGRKVELVIAVTPALWQAFATPAPGA